MLNPAAKRGSSTVHPPTVTQGYADPAGNDRLALRWNLNPAPIGGSLAEIAGIAEITGEVGSVSRWDGYPTPIGGSLAGTAETPASQVIRKRIISRQEVQPSRHPVSKPPVPGFPSPAPALRSCADCAAPRACPSPGWRCARNARGRPSPRPGFAACRARG
jgi:hypothetical protein